MNELQRAIKKANIANGAYAQALRELAKVADNIAHNLETARHDGSSPVKDYVYDYAGEDY